MNSPDVDPEQSAELMVIGFGMMAVLLLSIIGIGLGITGLCQKNRKNIFSILGTVFSGITALMILFFMLLGFAEG